MITPAALLLALAGPAAMAVEPRVVISAVTEYSDNVNSDPDPIAEDEFTETLNLGVGLTHEATDWDASVDYRLTHDEYIRNVLDDNTNLSGQSRLTWRPLAGWVVTASHARTERAQDRRIDTTSPQNQQIDNTFQLGSDFTARITPVDTLTMDVSALRRASQETANTRGSTANDSNRYSGGLAWRHRLSVPLSIGLRADASHAKFDSRFTPDLNSYNVAATLSRVGPRLTSEASLGYMLSKRLGRTSTGGISSRINATFAIDESQSLSLTVSRSVDDNDSDRFALADPIFGVADGNGAVSAVAVNTNAALVYAWRRPTVNFSASFAYNQSDFDNQELQRDDRGYDVGLRASYRANRSLTIDGSARFSRQKFPDDVLDRRDDRLAGSLGVTWRASQKLRPRLAINWNQTDRTDPTRNTREFSALVSLDYQIR